MSTTCAIIQLTPNSTNPQRCRGIYCHWDGYPEHAYATLSQHYQDKEKVDQLLELGDISSLYPEVAPDPDKPHTYKDRQKGVTVAYHRDRGEELNPAREAASPSEFIKDGGAGSYNYIYIWDGTAEGKPWRTYQCKA